MARKEKFNKETIVLLGAKFVKEMGIEKLNSRNLAKYMGCSTQPLFRNYENLNEYKKELKIKMKEQYNQFINNIIDKNDHLLTISYAYALYAKNEPNIFRALFITELAGTRTVAQVINSEWNRETIEATVKQYDMSLSNAECLYRDVRFYTHGIATQLCCKSIALKDEEIYELIKNVINKFSK